MKKILKRKFKSSEIFAAVFVFLLLYFGIFNCIGWGHAFEIIDTSSEYKEMTQTEKIEFSYSENFHLSNYFRNITAIIYNTLDRKILNEVYKDDNDALFRLNEFETERIDSGRTKKYLQNIILLAKYCKDNDIPFLYVSSPNRTMSIEGELPPNMTDYSQQNEETMLRILNQAGFATLDLRKEDFDLEFYKTDHHWTNITGFNISNAIINALEEEYDIDLDEDDFLSDIDNYYDYNFDNSFLGSEGVRVSSYYTQRDNFTLYIPKFATDNYLALMDGNNVYKEAGGTFLQAYIEESVLYDPYYDNKYNSLLYGAKREALLYNYLNTDKTRALFISDSYGCPVSMYLSMYFYELRFIDPSDNRYKGNFTRYMVEDKPDYVIVMYDGKIPTMNFDIFK